MGQKTSRVRWLLIGILAGLIALTSASLASARPVGPGATFPVSWLPIGPNEIPGTDSGILGMGSSPAPSSNNGRFVLVPSLSNSLGAEGLPDDLNLYRKDMRTGDLVLVSRKNGPSGAPYPANLFGLDISADGNLVVMNTNSQVSPDDTDDKADIYLRNIAAGTTALLTPGIPDHVSGGDLSADGRYLTFTTETALVAGDLNGDADAYRLRIQDGSIDIVSRIPGLANAGNASSYSNSISGDGRWVAFTSRATDLVTGFVEGNPAYSNDVFIRDMAGAVTYLVSSRFNSTTQGANDDSSEAVIAGSPQLPSEVLVAFTSRSTDLADAGVTDSSMDASVYLKSLTVQPSELISRATGAAGASADSRAHTPSISNDGSRIVFSSDASNLGGTGGDYYGVYLRDRSNSSTRQVSARNDYAVWGQISGDGTVSTWSETGSGTPDSDRDLNGVFRRNLNTNEIRYVSRPKGTAKVVAPGFNVLLDWTMGHRLSASGRYLAFATVSEHLPQGGEQRVQVYRRDLATGEILLVSRGNGVNGPIAEGAEDPTISEDGQKVAFVTWTALDPADTNDTGDVYVRDIAAGTTHLASRADGAAGAIPDKGTYVGVLSGDGNSVAFSTEATNLGYGGTSEKVFLRDMTTNKTIIISRADGVAGATANNNASSPTVSSDGSKVLFASQATNLSGDDLIASTSYYLRDRTTNQTTLVTREPGLAGSSITGFTQGGTLSPNGNRAAFMTDSSATVPATAPWPAGEYQIVIRNLADGTNTLGSASAGGQAGDSSSYSPSLSRDGSILGFSTDATNLRPDISLGENGTVAAKDMTTGLVTGPPLFGTGGSMLYGSSRPEISVSGDCLSFQARGHNAISGDLGARQSSYVFTRAGTCQNPRALVPRLSGVKIRPARFRVSGKATARVARNRKKAPKGTRIRFRLNTVATMTILFHRREKGRKIAGLCVRPSPVNRGGKPCVRFVYKGRLTRKSLAAGKRVVKFSGRIGQRPLKPGRYRATIWAAGPGGKSARVTRNFRIVK